MRSDDALRVWLNGFEIEAVQHLGERDLSAREDCATICLRKGWNTLLAAVAETHVEWAFSARITPSDDLRFFADHPAKFYAGWPTCESNHSFICVAGDGNGWNPTDPNRALSCVGKGIWRGRIKLGKEEFKFVADGDARKFSWGPDGAPGGKNYQGMQPGLYDVTFNENNPANSQFILVKPFRAPGY